MTVGETQCGSVVVQRIDAKGKEIRDAGIRLGLFVVAIHHTLVSTLMQEQKEKIDWNAYLMKQKRPLCIAFGTPSSVRRTKLSSQQSQFNSFDTSLVSQKTLAIIQNVFNEKSNLQVKTLLLLSTGSRSLYTQHSHCYRIFGVPSPTGRVRTEIVANEGVPDRANALCPDPKTIRTLDFPLQAKTERFRPPQQMVPLLDQLRNSYSILCTIMYDHGLMLLGLNDEAPLHPCRSNCCVHEFRYLLCDQDLLVG